MKFNFYLFVLLYCVLLIVPYAYSIIIETNYTYSGSFVTITIPNGINYAILTLYGASGGSGANSGKTIGFSQILIAFLRHIFLTLFIITSWWNRWNCKRATFGSIW